MKSFQTKPVVFRGRFANKLVVGVDSETTRIASNVFSKNNKSRIAQPLWPDLVVGSWALGNTMNAAAREEFLEILQRLANRPDTVFVFHNFAFDYNVIAKADADLGAAFRKLVNRGRVIDTKDREVLIKIAEGRDTYNNRYLNAGTGLAVLAHKRCGIKLDKDETVRCGFDQYVDAPLEKIPTKFLEYAATDAYATLAVAAAQEPHMERLHARGEASTYPVFPDARERFGLLGERVQAKGALALAWLEHHPVRVDLAEVERQRRAIWAEYQDLEERMISYGWARRTPKTKQFKMSFKAIREVLAAYAKDHGLTPPLSDTGLLTLEYDYWRGALPRVKEVDPADERLEARLQRWLQLQKLRKMISTYLDAYGSATCHYPNYWNLGCRTTRTSSNKPNIQNVPKRNRSLRSMFVPRPGYKLWEIDYCAAELVALAQVHVSMYGASVLADDINAGRDPHIETARRIAPEEWEAADATERKRLRQLAKALNFGFPGGLGAKTFTVYAKRGFGLDLTLEEARQIRKDFLKVNPQLASYLADNSDAAVLLERAAGNLRMAVADLLEHLRVPGRNDGNPHLGVACARLRNWSRGDTAYHIPTPPGFRPQFDLFRATTTGIFGFARGRASYTEQHNTPFQSIVAAALKLGLWGLFCEHQTADDAWAPICQVHDSVLLEVREGEESRVPLLAELFRQGLTALTPDVKAAVEVDGPKSNWGAKIET